MKDMTSEQAHAYAEALAELDDWPMAVKAHLGRRDRLIIRAHAAGVSQPKIAKRMKISRNTVLSVLGTDDSGEDSRP